MFPTLRKPGSDALVTPPHGNVTRTPSASPWLVWPPHHCVFVLMKEHEGAFSPFLHPSYHLAYLAGLHPSKGHGTCAYAISRRSVACAFCRGLRRHSSHPAHRSSPAQRLGCVWCVLRVWVESGHLIKCQGMRPRAYSSSEHLAK